MSKPLNLFLDVNNYLNNDYAAYSDKVHAKALSNPSAYFEYREKVSKQLKADAIKNLYATIYYALRFGQRADETDLVPDMIAGSPNVSDQNINEIAISIAKTLNEQLDKIVDIIAPVSASGAASGRLKSLGNATTYKI